MLKIVSNTTLFISLLKIGQLELLRKIYKSIIVPEEVFAEVEKGKNKPYYTDISRLNWINIQEIKDKKVLSYFFDLDAGEAEVIVIATEIEADLVIIDEMLGRRYAKNAGLKVTGTIGILIKAKEIGLVKKVTPLLDEMKEKGIWISNKLKKEILNLVNE